MPEVRRVLSETDPSRYSAESTAHAERLRAFAERQQKSGFPYVAHVGAVRAWTVIEAAVRDRARDLLADDRVWRVEALQRLEGPLVPFALQSREEQIEKLLDMMTAPGDGRTPGVGAFEPLLHRLGLVGSVEDEVRRALFELGELRHVVVHRNGLADKRYLERIRGASLRVGDPVVIEWSRFRGYLRAAVWYFLEIERRVWTIYPPASAESCPEYIAKIIRVRDRVADAVRASRESADLPLGTTEPPT